MLIQVRISLVICIILCLSRPISMQFYECVTPQRLRGFCIPIQQCNFLLNIARYNSYESNNFLRQSQCGFNGFSFCCPSTQLTSKATMAQRQIQTQTQRTPNQFQSQTQYQMGRNQFQSQSQQQRKNLVVDVIKENLVEKVLLPKPPNCGIDAPNRIFGGSTTEITEFPWFALLKYTKPGTTIPSFGCGGSLINDRYVVTAAHCVHPERVEKNNRLTAVRLGEWNLTTNPDCEELVNEKVCNDPHVDVGVEETIIHENYAPRSKNQYNDIALLRLNRKVSFTEFIRPICISPNPASLVGMSTTVTGFGVTESAPKSNVKLKVALDVVDNQNCSKSLRVILSDGQICAGGKRGFDSCRGDSGGPLMQFVTQNGIGFWKLVGLVSFGANPCGESLPAVYTKVDNFIPWIESKLKS